MNARDPTSIKSVPSSRGQAAIVHVDLGADLKSAVFEAALKAGVRPSEWMRSQLALAVSAVESRPQGQSEAALRRRHVSTESDQTSASKAHQLSLQSDDLAWLEEIAQSGGFRSRPAALRYALRVLASVEGLAALRQLPNSVPLLVESNITLQAAVRSQNHLPVGDYEPSRVESLDKASFRREIGDQP